MTVTSCTKTKTQAVEGKLTGTIQVSKELESKLKKTDVLYIIARDQQIGPPSAVKRIAHPKFPLTFQIGPEDAMIPNASGFEPGSKLTVSARISRTGNAIGAPGDLEGIFIKNPVVVGSADVNITIDKVRN